MQVVGIPELQLRVADILEALQLPVTEVQLQESLVKLGLVAAVARQPTATTQRTAVDGARRLALEQQPEALTHRMRLVHEGGAQRHVRTSVADARGDVDRGMAYEVEAQRGRPLILRVHSGQGVHT